MLAKIESHSRAMTLLNQVEWTTGGICVVRLYSASERSLMVSLFTRTELICSDRVGVKRGRINDREVTYISLRFGSAMISSMLGIDPPDWTLFIWMYWYQQTSISVSQATHHVSNCGVLHHPRHPAICHHLLGHLRHHRVIHQIRHVWHPSSTRCATATKAT